MRNKNTSKFILAFIILLLVLLILLLIYINILKVSDNYNSDSATTIVGTHVALEDVVNNSECEFLSRDKNNIYVNFSKDLYDTSGNSNQAYFESLVNNLIQFFEAQSFNLIDNKLEIRVSAEYDYKSKEYNIIYNNNKDFYAVTDGKSYNDVNIVKIANGEFIFLNDKYLILNALGNGYFTDAQKELGEGIQKENNYTDYLNGTLSVRVAINNGLKNIIYKKGYEGGNVVDDITIETPLSDVYSKYGDSAFGSLEDKFLGYRSNDFYIFFYENEISIYPYSYENFSEFNSLLKKYIETNDLNEFAKMLKSRCQNYDKFEFDEENQNLSVIFASRGIEVNIKNNEPKGITLYSNYYYTNEIKKLVKDGYVNINIEEDLVNKLESNRRKNTLEL